MTTTKGAEMSVTVNNSPIQDYSSCIFTLQAIMLHLLIKIMTPGFKHNKHFCGAHYTEKMNVALTSKFFNFSHRIIVLCKYVITTFSFH